MEKLGIIGCGWLGEKIAAAAISEFKIFSTTTSADKLEVLNRQNFNAKLVRFSDEIAENFTSNFTDFDILIITIPFSQRTPLPKLIQKFENIIQFIGNFKGQMFLCSSTGIYPQIDTIITENSLANYVLTPNIFQIEQLMQKHFPQITILRFGGLMGADRIFSKYYQNKPFTEPEQAVNHTHYEDICRVILHLINLKTCGKIYNVVAPEHPSKIDVFNCQTKHICDKTSKNNPGKKVSSQKLIDETGFRFLHPNPMTF